MYIKPEDIDKIARDVYEHIYSTEFDAYLKDAESIHKEYPNDNNAFIGKLLPLIFKRSTYISTLITVEILKKVFSKTE